MVKTKKRDEEASWLEQYNAEREADAQQTGTEDPIQAEKIRSLGDVTPGGLADLARVNPDKAKEKIATLKGALGAPGQSQRAMEDTPYLRGTHVLPSGEEIPFFTNRGGVESDIPGEVRDLQPYLSGTEGAPGGTVSNVGGRIGDVDATRTAKLDELELAEAKIFPTATVKGAQDYLPKLREREKKFGPDAAARFLTRDIAEGALSADEGKRAAALRETERVGEHQAEKIKLMDWAEGLLAEGKGVKSIIDAKELEILDPKTRRMLDLPAWEGVKKSLVARVEKRPGQAAVSRGVILPWLDTPGKQKPGGEAIPETSTLDEATAEKEAVMEGVMQAEGQVRPPTTTTYDLATGKGTERPAPGMRSAFGEGGIKGVNIPGLENIFSYNPEEWGEGPGVVEPLREFLGGVNYAAGGKESRAERRRRLERERKRLGQR